MAERMGLRAGRGLVFVLVLVMFGHSGRGGLDWEGGRGDGDGVGMWTRF